MYRLYDNRINGDKQIGNDEKLGGIEMKELKQLLGIMQDVAVGNKSMEEMATDLQTLKDELESEIEKHPLHEKYKDKSVAELETEILNQLAGDSGQIMVFDKQLNEQCRNLMLKSGLDIELPLKRSKVNEVRIKMEIAMLEEAGFSVGIMNLDDMDNIFVLEKNEIPIYCFLEIHDGEYHAITEIFEVIDGDINKTLESILS